jgi:hypothetical protein
MSNKSTFLDRSPFSSDWWTNTFLEGTCDFTKTCVFKNCIDTSDIEDLKKEVLNTLKTVCDLRTDEYGFRIYTDGDLISSREMKAFYKKAPKQEEDIAQWFNRAFKKGNSGIILNSAEVLNPVLAKKIALKIMPLLKNNGMPLLGYNMTLFIGDYGFTPLGIHKDPPGESVMHFHLGPEKKVIYQWNDKDIEDKVTLNKVETLLPFAKPYEFNIGDLYFMPSKNYHIGETKKLSVGIALWSNKNFTEELSKKIFDTMEKNNALKLKSNNTENIDTVNLKKKFSDYFDFPENKSKLTLKNLLTDSYKDYRYTLYSNGGYSKAPLLDKKNRGKFLEQDFFVLEHPFKIQYYSSSENLITYVRGRKFLFKKEASLIKIINYINNAEIIQVKELFRFTKKRFTSKMICEFLSDLELYHGIKKLTHGIV